MQQTERERREAEKRAIRADIRNCEDRIDELNGELGRLEQKIAVQQEVQRSCTNMNTEVQEVTARKREHFHRMELYVAHVKFLYGYQSQHYEFLDGRRASDYRERMEAGRERMEHIINTNIQRSEELKRQIAANHDKIAKLCRKLGGI